MRLLLLFTATLITFYLKSQNNDLNINSSWHCYDLDGTSQCKDTRNFNSYFIGDTVISGNQYLKLYNKGYTYNSLFTAFCPYTNQFFNGFNSLVRYYQNKLYVVNGLSEDVYIDYNLHIGDSIKNVLFTTTPLKITRIDSVNINGNYLNRFFYKSINSADTGYVIEKIGSNHGFIAQYTPFFESRRDLICYAENNITVYNDPHNNTASCDITLNTKTNHLNSLQLQIFPNPVTNEFMIEFKNSHQTINKMIIKNYLGQIIQNIDQPKTNFNFDISFLKSGMYFIELETEKGTVLNKIIKQ